MYRKIVLISLLLFNVSVFAQTTYTPNMSLPISTIGQASGLLWEQNLNAALRRLDQHNHSSGFGARITPNGININSDLSFIQNNATNLRTTRYTSQNSPLSNTGSDVCEIFVSGNELYYNDCNGGNTIQITSNGSVNAGAGSIGGLPSGTASVNYSAGTYTFQSATNTAGNIDGRSYVLRNSSVSSHKLTLNPPAAMASDTAVTLPAVPAARSLLTIDTSGNITAMSTFPNVGTDGQQYTANSGSTEGALWTNGDQILNMGLSASVATNALTITLKNGGGTTPSSTSPVIIPFRSATSTTGQFSNILVTGALTIVVPSSATLGQVSGVDQYVWVYAINNAGTVELGVSGVNVFDDLSVQTSTTISSGATSGSVLYAITGVSSKAIRLIGRLLVNEVAAGTWASAPTVVSLNPKPVFNATDWSNAGTITITSTGGGAVKGTASTDKFWTRRIGGNLEGRIEYRQTVAGTAGSGDYKFLIPNSLSINTSQVTANTTVYGWNTKYLNTNAVGVFSAGNNASAGNTVGYLTVYDANNLRAFMNDTTQEGALAATVYSLANTDVYYIGSFSVPILGWSAYGP